MKRNSRCDEEREKHTNFTQRKHTIRPQIVKTIPPNQENPKDSNEPCNLGSKRDKEEFK